MADIYIWAFSKLCKIMRFPMLILCAKKCLVTITLLCTHGPTTGPTHRFKDCRTTNTQPHREAPRRKTVLFGENGGHVGGVEWSKTFWNQCFYGKYLIIILLFILLHTVTLQAILIYKCISMMFVFRSRTENLKWREVCIISKFEILINLNEGKCKIRANLKVLICPVWWWRVEILWVN